MKGSGFISDYARLLYYKCHKPNINCCGSYTTCSDWIKNNKKTINTMNKKYN